MLEMLIVFWSLMNCFLGIVDDQSPVIADCPPAPITASTDMGLTTSSSVTFAPTATDAVDPAPTVACVPASGSVFPLGDTTVTCTATDSSSNMDTCSFNVTVEGNDKTLQMFSFLGFTTICIIELN